MRRAGDYTSSAGPVEIVDPFKIPGLAAREQSDAGINVLKRVFLDPRSGQLVFIGRYDPAYATGAIDYTTLLHDALRSPTPSFSLEPTAASKAASANFVRQFDQQMAANLRDVETGKAWLTGIFDQLLSNPALEVDRRRFLAKGAKFFNVKPEEVPALMQAMLGRTETGSPPWVNFWVKFYQALGSPQAAGYIFAAAHKDTDPQAFRDAFDWLGLTPVMNDLRLRIQNGTLNTQVAERMLEVEVWVAIHQSCKIPESRWRAAADRARRTGDIDAFRAFNDDLNANILREYAMEPWLNGLVLSETFLQVVNRMPPIEVAPVFADGLDPESELARTFLSADWILKNLGVTPEIAERVPGHRTPSQFTFELQAERRVYDLGDINVSFWLEPTAVSLLHDPAGTVIDFAPASVAVRAKVTAQTRVGSSAAEQVGRDAMSGYASEITRRYDDYARALPDLHRLREAAKIIALVRWAKNRQVSLVPPGPAAAPSPLPAKFGRGFWTGNFDSNPEKTFFGLVAIGGVDFSPEVGTAWLQPREDAALGSTALQQLAGSAALGQQAADAALRGDLESARRLADQSARAMTGDFDLSAHPELGKIPEVPPPDRVTQVELQNELVTQNTRAIAALAQASSAPGPKGETQRAQAQEHIRQIQGLLASDAPPPAQARQWVKLLRNGDWASLPASKTRPQTVATAPAPTPATAQPVVDPAERARIRDEITQLRTELCRAQTQLRRFSATIQSDQAQRDEWVKVTNDAYESALARAKEKLAEFSVDFPEEKLNERLEKLTDPAERAKVERALRLVQHLKESYKLKDFASWAEQENYGRKEVLEGIGIIVDIIGVEDAIKDYLRKRWGLKHAIAFQEAGSDLVVSAYDVTAEVVAWRRLKQLNQNSDDFLKAVEKSGERVRAVVAGIHEREVRLGLDPGATRNPCP